MTIVNEEYLFMFIPSICTVSKTLLHIKFLHFQQIHNCSMQLPIVFNNCDLAFYLYYQQKQILLIDYYH